MHYTIDYNGLTGRAKSEKAIQDCRDYLGGNYSKVIHALRTESRTMIINRTNIRTLMCGLAMFVGIQGYPAKALVFHALRTKDQV